jgi:transcriptional regulator with XRE-family HTH domain
MSHNLSADKQRAERIASEFIRALRGRRSQLGLSRRLQSKSNVVYTWESGRRWPTAAKFFWVAERIGIDVESALTTFFRATPPWLTQNPLTSATGVAVLLRDLKGKISVGEIAARCGFSRFAVSRWLKGQAEPRLPEFLRLIEALSLRLLDFIAAFVDPERLPEVKNAWRELQAARQAAYDLPWSHAFLRLLETEAYARQERHVRGWLAAKLGLSVTEEERCLSSLTSAGQIAFDAGLYRVREVQAIDTRRDPAGSKRLPAWWAHVALKRLEDGAPGRFSYNLFTVSAKDYQRLEELHLAYFRELRAIVAQSSPAERVALVNMQLLPLAET